MNRQDPSGRASCKYEGEDCGSDFEPLSLRDINVIFGYAVACYEGGSLVSAYALFIGSAAGVTAVPASVAGAVGGCLVGRHARCFRLVDHRQPRGDAVSVVSTRIHLGFAGVFVLTSAVLLDLGELGQAAGASFIAILAAANVAASKRKSSSMSRAQIAMMAFVFGAVTVIGVFVALESDSLVSWLLPVGASIFLDSTVWCCTECGKIACRGMATMLPKVP